MTRISTTAMVLAASLTTASGCAPAYADQPEVKAETVLVEVPDAYIKQIHTNKDSFLTARVQDIYRYNPTGTVTQADVDKFRLSNHAKQRAGLLQRYLGFDLDGDGTVTRDEFEQASVTVDTQGKAQLDIAFSQSDLDSDGKLSFRELVAVAESVLEKQDTRRSRFDDNPLMFDRNRDGQVDVRELTEVVDALAAEPLPAAASPSYIRRAAEVPVCTLPAVSDGAEVLIVSGYGGSGLSTVAVSGVNAATSTATVMIDPGKTPLYIVAVSLEPMVWNVTGATGRVEKFVVQPPTSKEGPGAGVVGLDRSKVSFIKPGSCGKYASEEGEAASVLLKSSISAALSRDVDGLAMSYRMGTVKLPSGEVSRSGPPTKGRTEIRSSFGTFMIENGEPILKGKAVPDRLASSLLQFSEQGLVKYDVKDVVASAPVVAYDVMPEQAGLAQLVLSGHLTLTSDNYYIIEKTFPYFPAELTGAQSVKFLLRKGVEMPGGSPGHSSVISEETRECLTFSCR